MPPPNPPQIESERLILRLAVQDDLLSVIEYWRNNKDHLAPFGPKWPEDFFTESFWKTQIDQLQNEFAREVSVRMFLFERATNAAVGHLSFAGIMRSAAQFCYLGYGLAQDRQGRGYMSEIVPCAIKYAFEELKLHRVMANYMPTNERSGRLLKRLGFTVEGYARDYLCLNGKWENHILTSITNHNYQA